MFNEMSTAALSDPGQGMVGLDAGEEVRVGQRRERTGA